MAGKTGDTAQTIDARLDALAQELVDSGNASVDAVAEAQSQIVEAETRIAALQSQINEQIVAARAVNDRLGQLGYDVIDLGGMPRLSKGRNGSPSKGRSTGKRASNSQSLEVFVMQALSALPGDETASPAEVEAAVTKAGYTSGSDNFNVIVNQTLGRLRTSKLVKRPERAQYALAANGVKHLASLAAAAAESESEGD